jgi:hypothetical protein
MNVTGFMFSGQAEFTRWTASRKQMWWTDMPKADDKPGRQSFAKCFANGRGDVRGWSGFGCGSGVVRVWYGCEHPS